MKRTFARLTAALILAAAAAAPGPAIADTPLPPSASQAELAAAAAKALARGERPQELKRARPAWFTKRMERRLRRDRDGVMPLPAAAVDAPLPGEIGIRPGTWLISPYWCTTNFVFTKRGTLAIGTAGHCLDNSKPIALTLAPGGANPVLVELGKVLLKRDAGIGADYGLIEVPTHLRAWTFPTIGVVGGPCGVYAGDTAQPVFHYGHGSVGGTGGTPRAGMGFELERDPIGIKGTDWDWDSDSFIWAGELSGGDSGSAVREGLMGAVGDLTHGIGITGLEPSAIGWGTRVTTVTGNGWQVVSSPLCL